MSTHHTAQLGDDGDAPDDALGPAPPPPGMMRHVKLCPAGAMLAPIKVDKMALSKAPAEVKKYYPSKELNELIPGLFESAARKHTRPRTQLNLA